MSVLAKTWRGLSLTIALPLTTCVSIHTKKAIGLHQALVLLFNYLASDENKKLSAYTNILFFENEKTQLKFT